MQERMSAQVATGYHQSQITDRQSTWRINIGNPHCRHCISLSVLFCSHLKTHGYTSQRCAMLILGCVTLSKRIPKGANFLFWLSIVPHTTNKLVCDCSNTGESRGTEVQKACSRPQLLAVQLNSCNGTKASADMSLLTSELAICLQDVQRLISANVILCLYRKWVAQLAAVVCCTLFRPLTPLTTRA